MEKFVGFVVPWMGRGRKNLSDAREGVGGRRETDSVDLEGEDTDLTRRKRWEREGAIFSFQGTFSGD